MNDISDHEKIFGSQKLLWIWMIDIASNKNLK